MLRASLAAASLAMLLTGCSTQPQAPADTGVCYHLAAIQGGKARFNVVAKGVPPEALDGVYAMHYFYYDLSSFEDRDTARSAQEFTELFRAKYQTPPDAYAAIAYIAYMEMFRGFEAAKSFDPRKVSAALMAGTGDFNTVKGPARWRQDHEAVYKHAAFLVKGKGPAEQKGEWDLFTVMGSLGGESVMPTLKSLGY